MLPTKKTPPKQDLANLTVLVHGPTKFGKCLAGNTTLIDPQNGSPRTIRELVERQEGDILTMKDPNSKPILPTTFSG
jgi:hypothetical protein